jgi:hypothetical protein
MGGGDLTPEHLTKEMIFEYTNLEGGSVIVKAGQNMNLM